MEPKNAQKNWRKIRGFSLIEVILVVGILASLIAGAFLIGWPDYDRYVLTSERQFLVDTLIESRTRSEVSNMTFEVKSWSNGYCIVDRSGLCVQPSHLLPSNLVISRTDYATSTKMVLCFTNYGQGSSLSAEIDIDQYGYIDQE